VRVVYFGTYERRYPRNAQVVSCLRRAGVEVIERHEPVWEAREEKWSVGARDGLRLALAQVRLRARRPPPADIVLVGYPGHLDLHAARRAARGKPVVFNPLVSLYDTLVGDRGRFEAGSRAARALRWVDRRAFRAADLVVADTEAHADFLAELSGLPRQRFAVCLVGAEERLFAPGWKPGEPFTALFVGKLIPLHGVATILEAARLAPGVRIRVVGSGQLGQLLASRPANVEWLPWVVYERLAEELRGASCALGIFGVSDKARRVIPNKAFQALACGVPLVTADTPAARELLTDGETALLVPPGEPEALAAALRRLADEPDTARRIAEAGHAVYRERASEDVLGRRWRSLLERLAA
jgi:glycosyltransferase involved in cell wall biosynthesis